MAAIGNGTTARSLYDLIGIADNLDEPQPFINRREAILGITIAFMVRACGTFRAI